MPTSPANSRGPLLQVENLSVVMRDGVKLVDDVSFTIGKAERVVLVGESGSGKSVTAQALTRLNPRLTISGRVLLDDADLLPLPDKELERVRGALPFASAHAAQVACGRPTRTRGRARSAGR